MKNIELIKYMKGLKKRTKIEVIGVTLLMVVISLSSVFGNPDGNDSTILYIRNGNGNFWIVANATNLQESLNQRGVTYFPAVTIYTNHSITIPSNASLIGTGLNSILKADIGFLGNHSLIENKDQTNGNANLEVRNLVLDGSNTTHTQYDLTQYGLYWKKVSYGIVDMVWVKDTAKDGIRLYTCDHCSVTHINANNTGHHSVIFCYGTSYSLMSDLIITNSYRESAIVEHANATGGLNHHITIANVIAKNCGQYGIFVRDAYSVAVTGCITEHSDDNGFYAGVCHDVIFSNCVTNDNEDHAGFIINITANGVILSDCIARHAGKRSDSRGFELRGQNIQVSNCAVYDTKTPFYFNHSAKNITINMCNIVNYTRPSIVLGDNIRLRDNTFLTNAITPYVLNITSDSTNILVIGNDFRYAHTSLGKIYDPSAKAIILNNIELSSQPPTPPSEEIDQQQTNYSLDYLMYSTRWAGQTFTPTKELLTRVEIYMRKIGSPPNDVTLSVRTSRGGADLVNLSKPASEIPTSYSWVSFDFSDLNLTPGNTYYLVLRTDGGTSQNCYYWGYGYHTSYTNGIRFFSNDGGSSWINNPSYDNCFKTYGI
jgi:hypothetical protein